MATEEELPWRNQKPEAVRSILEGKGRNWNIK